MLYFSAAAKNNLKCTTKTSEKLRMFVEYLQSNQNEVNMKFLFRITK